MSRVRKYIIGEVIKDPIEALREIIEGRYIFCNHKPMHPGWSRSWQIGVLCNFVSHGSIKKAIINPEWREPKPKPED